MSYKIILTNSAEKELYKLQESDIKRVVSAIDSLQLNPRPRGSIKLKGQNLIHRLRKGNFRIIYSIDDSLKKIKILIIRNRKDAYK